MPIKITLVDDHLLVRSGIRMIIEKVKNFTLFSEVSNGKELLEQLSNQNEQPDIILMDIKMPLLDGIETTKIINEKYPNIKIIALTIYNDMDKITSMIKNGARAYLLKDVSTENLQTTIENVYSNNYYFDEFIVRQIINPIYFDNEVDDDIKRIRRLQEEATKWLTDREKEFMILCCSELTYKEIAVEMKISHNTVNNYRENVFDKLSIKSRIGIVLFAINHGLFVPKFK